METRMTMSKWIPIISLIFGVTTVCQAQSIQPREEMSFKLEQGSRFQLCKDVTTYLNTYYRAHVDKDPREVFEFKVGKFNRPKSTPSTEDRFVQLKLQHLAHSKVKLSGRYSWKNRIYSKIINSIESIIQKQLVVQELKVDINNDGVREHVFHYSFYEEEYRNWIHINYVLDDNGNLNLAFENRRSSLGELFYYDGRTYSYTKWGRDKIRISEHFPSYRQIGSTSPENVDGLIISPPICKITQTKSVLNNEKD